MILDTITMKCRQAFKGWQQKAFLQALPGQCAERWFTHFAI